MENTNNKQFRQIGFILIAIVLFASGCKKEAAESESIRPVFYQKISTSEGGNQFIIPGIVQYKQESKLSFKVGGVIRSKHVAVGQKVIKGSLLATIDDTDYEVSYKQAQASDKAVDAGVQNARSQLTNAKSNFLRIEQLYINNHTSLSEFEKAKVLFENAKSGLEAAQSQAEASSAQVIAKRNQLNYTKLISPVDGTVSQIFFEENESVGIGVPVMILASDNNFEVRALVPETWVSQLKIKQEVEVAIASLDEKFKGIIKEISPDAPTNSGYPIKISFHNNIEGLKSGMSVKVHILNVKSEKSIQRLIIDTDAVSNDADGYFVYVLVKNKDNTYLAKRKTIEVGELTKNGYIVHKGLENNQMIATAGIRFLYDGKVVKLQEQKVQ